MMFKRQLLFSILLVICCLPSVSVGQAGGPVLPPDVRLVIDVSGSMKLNDPNNLRQPAVELLVQLLPEGSKAGIWTFGRWVNMLVKHQKVDDAWRYGAGSKSGQINSLGMFTNIGEALEKAAYGIDPANKQYRSSIILLTDGMVDISKDREVNRREWRRIVDEVLPRLEDAGVVIHTIALSDNADIDLLNKLSLSTDGISAVAYSADDLMRIFLKAFDASVPMEQVPLSEEGFLIDASVEEFTALIFRKNKKELTQIVGPDQQVMTAKSSSKYVKWYRAAKYDLITVKQPLQGRWQVLSEMDPDSRITVVSNLNLRVSALPNNILKGQQESVSLVLQEDGSTIAREEFLSLMDISAELIGGKDEFDLRELWSQTLETTYPPTNGVFDFELPTFNKEGIYQLTITVDGKSFIREFSHQFTTRQPFSADLKEDVRGGQTSYILTARVFDTDVVVNDTKIVATIISPNGRKKIRPLRASGRDTWKTTIRPQAEGEYIAKIKIRGKNEDGGNFEQNIDPIRFNYSIDQGFIEEDEPFFEEEEPEPEPTEEPTPEPADEEVEEENDDGDQDVSETPEDEAESEESQEEMPGWLLYSVLGLSNVLLFGLGFMLFRKILRGGNNEEILDQFSEANVEQEVEQAAQAEAEEELEEEPPMEDIDPVVDDIDPEPEPAREVTETFDELADDDLDPEGEMEMPMDDELMAEVEEVVEEPEPEPISSAETEVIEMPMEEPEVEVPVEEEDSMDALDDLDQMAVDAEEASEAPVEEEEEEEEEDMVSAMLKAQGLDLAEDELDDAISSLIDELENDDSFEDLGEEPPEE